MGLLGTQGFLCPPFLVFRESTSASVTFPELQRQVPTFVHQGREGMQRPGRSSQETMVQPRGRGLVPPPEIYITTSVGPAAELKHPTDGR